MYCDTLQMSPWGCVDGGGLAHLKLVPECISSGVGLSISYMCFRVYGCVCWLAHLILVPVYVGMWGLAYITRVSVYVWGWVWLIIYFTCFHMYWVGWGLAYLTRVPVSMGAHHRVWLIMN